MENAEGTEKESSSFNIKDFLWLCVSRWYWFVIALALTCGYAVYYLMKTPKVYVSTAAILIKDNGAGSNGMEISQMFSDIGAMSTSANLNNEMVAIKSPVLMTEVVKRLGLDVNYTVKERLQDRVIYGSELPVTVKFLDLGENKKAALRLKVTADGKAQIGPFAKDGEKLSEKDNSQNMTVVIDDVASDTLETPLGRMLLRRNESFDEENQKGIEIDVTRIGTSAATGRALGALNTECLDNYSTVVHISLSDVNPERANDILQKLIEVYNENWIADRNQIAVSTSNFINERLAVIESELGDVDTDISSYKSQHQLPDVTTASSAFFSRSLQAQDEVAALSSQLSYARSVRDHLSNVANSFNVLPASTGLNNVGIEGQIGAYNNKLIERNNLVANSSTSNPLIIDYDNELAGMRQAILTAIDSYINTLNASIRASQSTQAMSASRLSASPNQAKYLLSVERQQKVKESLYLYLLQKREENELSQAFTAYNNRLVTPPGASGPVSPVQKRVLMMAVALGLLIPAGLLFLLELLNSTVRGRKDLDVLTIPFVGEIPEAGKQKTRLQKLLKRKTEPGVSQILVRKGSGNVINEAFRVIRTNLEFMIPSGLADARTIMLTSANPGSGKTFITVNLATVLSLKGKRIAVLDLDLRKASLSAVADSLSVGLTNYLTGSARPEDIVVRDLCGNAGVDLFPVGPIPPNPSELLYSDLLPKLIEDLKQRYDYVIIDCPPVEVVADAKIINRMVDLTLFVIRVGVLERAMLPEIQAFYDSGRYRHMAVILNGTVDPSNSLVHRANRFGYGYGYGYGYPKKK